MTEPNYYYTSGSFGTPEEVIQSQAAQIADLVTKEELSKRVVTAHRRLCDERAERIKELESEVARLTADAQESWLVTENLRMLVTRLARKLPADHKMRAAALDYLKRAGLTGNILREQK